jgi:hypothetical protein
LGVLTTPPPVGSRRYKNASVFDGLIHSKFCIIDADPFYSLLRIGLLGTGYIYADEASDKKTAANLQLVLFKLVK